MTRPAARADIASERSLAETAYDELKAKIYDFALLPGDRFTETEIAQQLLSFERTGSMPPEAAVEFVVSEFAKTKPRFERRARTRVAKRAD